MYTYASPHRLWNWLDAYWEKQTAEDIASAVSGAIGVENEVLVVPTEKVADREIARSLKSALECLDHVDAEDVVVRVENGEVILTGTVSTVHAREYARDAATHMPGVTDVQNFLIMVDKAKMDSG